MSRKRVACFIDGFNLYHAICDLKAPHLKWVNYRALASALIPPQTHELIDVFYFSAYADWLPDSKKRHVQFVKALQLSGVQSVMGKFKPKDRNCAKCSHTRRGHEEKQTDVNIALMMLDQAHKDRYDHAYLISNDSDLVPAIQMARANFPEKSITTVVPPHKSHSNELIHASTEKAKIYISHLERSLLPETILDKQGKILVTRPKEYTPPLHSLALVT